MMHWQVIRGRWLVSSPSRPPRLGLATVRAHGHRVAPAAGCQRGG